MQQRCGHCSFPYPLNLNSRQEQSPDSEKPAELMRAPLTVWARNSKDGFEACVGLEGLWRPEPFRKGVIRKTSQKSRCGHLMAVLVACSLHDGFPQ